MVKGPTITDSIAGQFFQMTCEATGDPKPKFYFFKVKLVRSHKFFDHLIQILSHVSSVSGFFFFFLGAGCSSEVEHSLMVRWVVGSILHGVDPLSYFSFQPVLHDWCNKGCGMCYPVCRIVHIKYPIAANQKE